MHESIAPSEWIGLLAAYVPLLGPQGNQLYDLSGNGRHGTLITMDPNTDWPPGLNGTVLDLDGIDDSVQITGTLGAPSTLTVVVWSSCRARDTSGAHVFSIGDVVSINYATSSVQGQFYNGASWIACDSVGGNLVGTGIHQIGYVLQAGATNTPLYIDGLLSSADAGTVSLSYTLGANTFIGRHGNGSTAYHLNGTVEQARVYGRIVTPQEMFSQSLDPLRWLRPQPWVVTSAQAAAAAASLVIPTNSMRDVMVL